MKIVLLADDFPPESFGGAGISTYELALGLRRAGEDVSIITTCRSKKDEGESEFGGLKLFKIASNYPSRWRSYVSINNRPVVRHVEDILKRLQPDVVHAHNIHLFLSFASLKVAKKYAKAVIFTARDTMTLTFGKLETARYLAQKDARLTWIDHMRQAGKRWNPLRPLFIRHYLSYADKIIAISTALQSALELNGIGPVEVIYNGIDVEEWQVRPDALDRFREKHGLAGKKVMLFSGRLSSQKGGHAALEALARVVKKMPDTALLVAGTADTYGQEMQSRARELHIENNIIFTGWLDREHIQLAYGAADVVLMLSIYLDPFGRVNIEAMAARKPVIGTTYGGTPEVVIDGKTGFVVDPRDSDAVAEKILDLLTHEEKARAFGATGYERAQKQFSLTECVQRHLALYKSLLSADLPK